MTNKENTRLIPAAVLVPILNYPDTKKLLFTVRSPYVVYHKSQISFPGGCRNIEDKDAVTTALRETYEEIGLDPRYVEILGVLPTYSSLPGFTITPVIGLVAPPSTYILEPREVSHVFEVPLAYAMNEQNYKIESAIYKGEEIQFDVLHYQQYRIWGATASITQSLCQASTKALLQKIDIPSLHYNEG